ncbi:hypothetical protein [Paenibacillus sp. FSL M7-0896]|uniref:DUF7667 family protein n=1 Tax=Paenibacillus sp. FSL M7-0896 TaxID=2921610 RepID=UPI0030DD9404
MSMVAIHKIHRQLAFYTLMCTDVKGNMIIGEAEMKLIMPLLKDNLLLVFNNDSLKALSFMAYEMGDTEWHMDICEKLDALEASLL